MKIRVLSDLHREFGVTQLPQIDADLIVLAGDVATKQNGLEWIRQFVGTTPTVYICGNHEFYGDNLPSVTLKLQDATKGTNINVLENTSIALDGWNVFGATLWSDLELQGSWESGRYVAGQEMNDYKRIRNSSAKYRRLTPLDTRNIHKISLQHLEKFLTTNDPEKSIVVTHHAPSPRSLPDSRKDEEVSCAYASNLEEFIIKHQPKLWIHGHIHHSSDYYIGKTRVVSNPQSYPSDLNPNFNPNLVITL